MSGNLWRVETQAGQEQVKADGITTTYGVLSFWRETGERRDPRSAVDLSKLLIKSYAPMFWLTVMMVAD